MRYSDYKMVSTFCLVLGGLCIVGALLAYSYVETYGEAFGLSLHDYPYKEYSVPLFLVGVVLFVLGLVTGQRGKEELRMGGCQSIHNIEYCINCGTKREINAQYCKKCGKKFE